MQAEFVARGIASSDGARQTDEYFEADEVHSELSEMLATTRTKVKAWLAHTRTVRDDLRRLYGCLLERDIAQPSDVGGRRKIVELLQLFPFTCRRAVPGDSRCCGNAGFVRHVRIHGPVRHRRRSHGDDPCGAPSAKTITTDHDSL